MLDRIGGRYRVTLDGNEQYDDVDGVRRAVAAMRGDAALARGSCAGVALHRAADQAQARAGRDVRALASCKPVIIDESDDSLDAFVRARALGYLGVSSKTCKGLYKSLINARALRSSGTREQARGATS